MPTPTSVKLAILLTSLSIVCLIASGDDTTTNDEVNIGSYEIARQRQFKAENHYVTSADGYVINVIFIPAVRKTNKRPVVFNHGSTQSSTYFMTNSVGARPKNNADLDAGRMSMTDLTHLFANDPTAKCLPLLLATCGHDVYLINRRGTEFSLGKVSPSNFTPSSSNLSVSDLLSPLVNRIAGNMHVKSTGRQTSDDSVLSSLISSIKNFTNILVKPQLNLGSLVNTFDPNYWNFSLDEQKEYDLPAILNWILNRTTSEKVAYVGHSLGNGLMFMLLSDHPEWADKVEPFLAWSPDFYLGHTTSILRPLLVGLQPITTYTSMPFPPTPIDPLTRTLLASLCQTKVAQRSICLLLEDLMWGFSGIQQETLPAFMASQFYSISTHEAAQLAQNTEKGKMYHFNFGSKRLNMQKYNQSSPPIYNVSRITSNSISLWHGAKDALATIPDVKLLKSDLRVKVDDRFIDEVPFNHYDLMFGKNVTQLVNLPSLQLIESYDSDS